MSELAAMQSRIDHAESNLASICDKVNCWCRESGVTECKDYLGDLTIRDTIDRLWSKISVDMHQLRCKVDASTYDKSLQDRIDRLVLELGQLRQLNDIQQARLDEQDAELDRLERENARLAADKLEVR